MPLNRNQLLPGSAGNGYGSKRNSATTHSSVRLRTKLFRLNYGDHACSFYDNRKEQDEVITSFVRAGLAKANLCVCVLDDRTIEDVSAELTRCGIDVDLEVEKGTLRFVNRGEWQKESEFDIASMTQAMKKILTKETQEQWSGLWVTVDMTWSLSPNINSELLGQSESFWNELIQGTPAVLLCQYNRTKIPPALIYHSLKTHPSIVTSNDVYRNYYYEPPDVYSDQNYEQKANWMLEQFSKAQAIEEERLERLRDQAVRIQAEESERRTKAILESITDAFVAVDEAWRFTYVNRHATEVLQRLDLDPQDLMGQNAWERLPDLKDTVVEEQCRVAMDLQKPVYFETLLPQIETWFEIHAYPSRDGLAIYIRDITKRKQTEARLQRSLEEKEILLHEIHHRVKNNLQVIASLLELQSREIDDPHLRDLFKEGQTRVRAMALIHERLSRSNHLEEISMSTYIHDLTSELIYTYGVDRSRIQINIVVDGASLPLNTAMTCALILQELISNAFKYAFPDARTGKVFIIMRSDDPDFASMQVTDDGVGLPAGLTFEDATSLGLRLVKLLTRQIDGTISLESSQQGTSCTLRFPVPQINSRKE
jgi:PAS domain S-box-containing protein